MQELFRTLRLSFFLFLFVVFHVSVFVRVVSSVERVSGKTPKNLRLDRWLALFCPRLSPLPFLLLQNLRLPPDPFSLFLFLLPGLPPELSPFPGCECHLTHWSPEPGQRVVPPFLRWFHPASVVSRPRRLCSFGQASSVFCHSNAHIQRLDVRECFHRGLRSGNERIKPHTFMYWMCASKIPKFCNFWGQTSVGTNGVQAFYSKF